jgi:hypothetical protein
MPSLLLLLLPLLAPGLQDRIQRCVQRCQDKAQEQLPSQPSPKDIEKAQALLANCAADCAQVRKQACLQSRRCAGGIAECLVTGACCWPSCRASLCATSARAAALHRVPPLPPLSASPHLPARLIPPARPPDPSATRPPSCTQEYEKQVPKLHKDIVQRLAQLK